ncbi:hypothetical protein HanPSC8_Chr08g0314301 [Helianthus annuus]|nr:hypothetical protein HanPSC8_Chr08g0314301 [Helianthus annuus]
MSLMLDRLGGGLGKKRVKRIKNEGKSIIRCKVIARTLWMMIKHCG